MTAATETLDPDPRATLTLVGGDRPFEVELRPMRTRELMRLLKIMTRGAYYVIPTLLEAKKEEIIEQVTATLIMAIPEAEDETIDFAKGMIDLVPSSEETAVQERAQLDLYLDNPEIGDLITILEAVIVSEREDMEALGNRLRGILKVAEKSGQFSEAPSSSGPPSSTGTSEAST